MPNVAKSSLGGSSGDLGVQLRGYSARGEAPRCPPEESPQTPFPTNQFLAPVLNHPSGFTSIVQRCLRQHVSNGETVNQHKYRESETGKQFGNSATDPPSQPLEHELHIAAATHHDEAAWLRGFCWVRYWVEAIKPRS
jgi:hypothetical protein